MRRRIKKLLKKSLKGVKSDNYLRCYAHIGAVNVDTKNKTKYE